MCVWLHLFFLIYSFTAPPPSLYMWCFFVFPFTSYHVLYLTSPSVPLLPPSPSYSSYTISPLYLRFFSIPLSLPLPAAFFPWDFYILFISVLPFFRSVPPSSVRFIPQGAYKSNTSARDVSHLCSIERVCIVVEVTWLWYSCRLREYINIYIRHLVRRGYWIRFVWRGLWIRNWMVFKR